MRERGQSGGGEARDMQRGDMRKRIEVGRVDRRKRKRGGRELEKRRERERASEGEGEQESKRAVQTAGGRRKDLHPILLPARKRGV